MAALALCLMTAPAFGQDKPSTAAGRGGESSGPSAAGGDKGGDKGADKGETSKDKEADKPPGNVGGYSWSDKPAKGKRRYAKRIKIDPNAPIAMYPGFRMLADGTSQVWVYVSRKVTVTAASTTGQPTFVLTGAQVAVRNNTNALVTEYFDTPLARARLKRDPAGAQLVLELREPVSVQHRIVDGPGGTSILYVDLPKAQKSYAADDFTAGGSRSTVRQGAVLPDKASKSKRGPRQ